MNAHISVYVLCVALASCMTQRTEPIGSCTQAISSSDLKYFPEHYLPYAKNKIYTITAPPDNAYSHYGKGKYAWDIATHDGNRGAPLVATIDGCVRLVKRNSTKRFGGKADADNANFVVLTWPKNISARYRAGADIESLYLHLDSVASNIRPGVCIKRGDPIGITGCTGWCTGTHLHYQVQERPANSSYWGQSVPIGFAERIAPRGNITAKSLNPGPMPGSSSGSIANKPPTSGVSSPGSGSNSQGTSSSQQSKPPSTENNQARPVDLDFACPELEKIGGSTPACLSRVPGFSNRPELIDCNAEKIEHCVMGCVQKSEGSNDECLSMKKPDAENDATRETGNDGDKKIEDQMKYDPLNNGQQVPASDLEQEPMVPKSKGC